MSEGVVIKFVVLSILHIIYLIIIKYFCKFVVMSKSNKCLLQDGTCNDLINGTTLVTDNVKIPETNLDMNLVGKELCRYHYNKLIVNENHRLARAMKKQQCAHPKHKEYTKDNKIGRPQKNVLVKIPK